MRSTWRIKTMVLPEQIEQNFEGQSFLILTNRSCVWPANHLYIKIGACEMPWQLEFYYRFSRSIKERLKRQCSKPYSYFSSSSPYYPHTFVSATDYSDLLKLCPPNTNKLPDHDQQVGEATWRAVHHQSVPKTLCEI